MNLDEVKRQLSVYLNKKYKFIYRGSRNQIEEFTGRIIKLFPSIFIIESDNGTIKAFSYADYVIKNIRINF